MKTDSQTPDQGLGARVLLLPSEGVFLSVCADEGGGSDTCKLMKTTEGTCF